MPEGPLDTYIRRACDSGTLKLTSIKFLNRGPEVCGGLEFDKASCGVSVVSWQSF